MPRYERAAPFTPHVFHFFSYLARFKASVHSPVAIGKEWCIKFISFDRQLLASSVE